MMALTSIETLTLVNKGLLNINNDLFKEIISKQDFSIKGDINPISIAFYVVPLINAAIRCGTQEEKKVIFEAFIEPNKEIESTKKGAKGTVETLKEQAVRNMVNAKSRQTKIVSQEREKIEQIIVEKDLLKNKILIIPINYDINRNITGLIANQIAAEYKRPTLLLIELENEYTGSARNYKGSEIENFRDFIRDSNFSNFSAGHQSAFGSSFDKDKLNDFISYSNDILKDVTYEDLYYVDFLFNSKCEQGIVSELAAYKYMYGQELNEPAIGILNLTVSKSNCSIIGSKKDTAKVIDSNGIVYMFFRMSDEEKELFEEILHKDKPTIMNIVARCSINEWGGRVTEQLLVDSYEIINKYIF